MIDLTTNPRQLERAVQRARERHIVRISSLEKAG